MANHQVKFNIKSAGRFIYLLLVLCLLLIPAGCTGTSGETEDDFSFMEEYEDNPSKAQETPAVTERTSIRILFPGYQPRSWNDVKEEIEKRTRKTLSISLDFIWKEHYSYISEIKTRIRWREKEPEVYRSFM